MSDAERSHDHIWHPYTTFSAMAETPLPIIVRGEGLYLYDEDGTRYLDAISSWWACSLGHGHPAVVEAIQQQAATLQHSILGNLSHRPGLELARRLSDLIGAHRHVHFASDGASAVEAALKIAVQYHTNLGRTGRHGFLALTDPYHGDTLGAVSVGYMESFHRPFKPLLFKTWNAPTPRCDACGRADPNCPAPCFSETRALLHRHRDELAAVVVEPLCQGAAGMRMYGPGYLRELAGCCREFNILLIVDEIATGFGKTGRMFAFQHAGIDPDIVCMGKALSAGYLPISAAVVRDEVYDSFSDQPEDHTFYHGHTYAGNPIAAAASLATLEVYAAEGLVERGVAHGKMLERELCELRGQASVRDVRILGIIGAVELAEAAHAQRARIRMLEQHILVRPLGSVIYLLLPLVTPPDTVRATAQCLAQAIRETA
jgi:adenosylmethionine-8-amino-7-oxononanoate aminotransferase